ncbi:DEAD-box type RNA helicase [Scheffersomyces coipomensis]|uniref:DEAD-box type RNA helicase n=1 Tax=Scheffersomyces coipomensis TaxID=1788519 RepID=UPI00315C83B8
MEVDDSKKPDGFDELVKAIEQSHNESGNSKIQESVLRECVKYLSTNRWGRHWFCDKYMFPISTHALILFSFPTNDVLKNLKPLMTSNLQNCEECLSHYNRGKVQLKWSFANSRKISFDKVEKFMSVILEWEVSWLLPIMLPAVKLINDKKDIELDANINQVILLCLYGPEVLRSNSTLREHFITIISHLLSRKMIIIHPKLLPGIFYLAFEGTHQEKIWSSLWFKSLIDNKYTAKASSIDESLVQEFSIHLYRIEDPKFFTTPKALLFWNVIEQLLLVVDNNAFKVFNTPRDLEVMSKHKNLRLYSLIRLLLNYIMAYQVVAIPQLFRVLSSLLGRFGSEFWNLAGQLQYKQVLDTTLANDEYISLLKTSPIERTDINEWTIYEVTEWLFSILRTLPDSQSKHISIKIVSFLFKNSSSKDESSSNQDIRIVRERALQGLAIRILNHNFDDGNLPDYKNKDFLISLLKLREIRAVVEPYSDAIVEYSLKSSSPRGTKLISHCIKYDISLLAHNSYLLLQSSIPTSFDTYPLLWNSFVASKFYTRQSVSVGVLKSLEDVVSVTKFVSSKTENLDKHLLNARIQHNENVSVTFESLTQLLEKLTLTNQEVLRNMFADSEVLQSFWSCNFAPLVNQAATDVFYEVSDSGVGRLEAIQQLLSTYLKPNLDAIQVNINAMISMEAFEPCPKGVRIVMDILKALMDPSIGVCVMNPDAVKYSEDIISVWKTCWYFMSMIYKKTFEWASQHHLEELVEFTRDVLDCSHVLFDSYRQIIQNVENSNDRWNQLFKVFMNALDSAVFWLRLGDPSLLNSCLSLIIMAFSLANELNFNIDENFIESCAKFGVKYKRFNNKLNDQQRNELLSASRSFNPSVVERIEEELKVSRSKSATPVREVIEFLSDEESAPKNKSLKQSTLSKFVDFTKEIPVAPEPKKVKSSSLDAIRKDLQSSRVQQKKPVAPIVAPAPPRPAGFNSKRAHTPVSVGRPMRPQKKQVESDSSDDESDVDMSDLFYDSRKGKKKTVTEVDFNGRPIVKEKSVIDQRKKDEENMRARLNVSLKPLYSTILKWNYNSNDEFPSQDLSIYQSTKDEYEDAKDYVKSTEPLFVLECWSQIQSVKNTTIETPFEIQIGSRTTVDGFFDVYASVKKSVISDRKIGETDLLVLGVKTGISSTDYGRYLKSPSTRTCLAKVREIKSANSEYFDITIRVYPSGPMMGVLTPKSEILAMKVMQMITVEREFTSLKGLEYYDLYEDILKAETSVALNISDTDASKILDTYDLNLSQAKAILGSYNSKGFSLIQGPPGTGKTKTILGIVGYSLSHQQKENVISLPDQKRAASPALSSNPQKILVCAPSNAAVDELVLRLRDGVKNSEGKPMNPKVVRLGRSDVINAAVRDLTLEEQVEKELSARSSDFNVDPSIRQELSKCSEEMKKVELKRQEENLTEEEVAVLETDFHRLRKQKSQLAQKLDDQREKASIAYRTREYERRMMQAKVLSEAQIICSTLSGSAVDMLANLGLKFEQVIIDEACQSVELSAIIPLRYGCKKCIMVGDPNQLPPTVISKAAANNKYDQSLFVRIQQKNPESVYLLDVQYRMHPDISAFPSREFYNSKLLDGEGMSEKNERPWHKDAPLLPYQIFNIIGAHERNELSRSLFNIREATVALELVEKLINKMSEDFSGRIGIISPYKEQIKTIKNVFIKKYGKLILSQIDFNTVDGFQGQEKEIIIMSCVRASETGNVGFLSDIRRMNVALTRARTTLWILGNTESLSRNAVWKRLIENAKERNRVVQAVHGFLSVNPTKRKIGIDKAENPKKQKNEVTPMNSRNVPANSTAKPNVYNYSRVADTSYGRSTPRPVAPRGASGPKLGKGDNTISSQSTTGPKISKSGVLPSMTQSKPIKVVQKEVPEIPSKPANDEKLAPSKSGYLPSNGKIVVPTTTAPVTSTSGKITKNPVVPTSSGTIKPPPAKSPPSIFIQRRRPNPKK